jgi:hypothetical protein
LFPNLPSGYSRTPHMSFNVTDYPTAFDEGFATHFQAVVRRLTHNTTLHDEDLGLTFKPLVPYWLSNLDRAARTDGVRRNWFVQLQAPQGAEHSTQRSTLFDVERLKNGNQMLASEGVVATLFYRWLAPGPGDQRALLARYSAMFDAFAALNKLKPKADAPLMVQLSSLRIARCFQGQRAGADDSARHDLRRDGRRESHAARRERRGTRQVRGHEDVRRRTDGLSQGDGRAARGSPEESRESGRRARPEHLAVERRADRRPGQGSETAINLNTAERDELLKLPGVDEAAATKLLESRRAPACS